MAFFPAVEARASFQVLLLEGLTFVPHFIGPMLWLTLRRRLRDEKMPGLGGAYLSTVLSEVRRASVACHLLEVELLKRLTTPRPETATWSVRQQIDRIGRTHVLI